MTDRKLFYSMAFMALTTLPVTVLGDQASKKQTLTHLESSLEASLETAIKSGNVKVQGGRVGTESLSEGVDIVGLQCQSLTEFSKTEGLDSYVRLSALKSLRLKLKDADKAVLSIQAIYQIKDIGFDELGKAKRDNSRSHLRQALELLTSNSVLRQYIEAAKTARAELWGKLSADLKGEMVEEAKNQTGLQDAHQLNALIKDGTGLKDPKIFKAMEKAILCFAELELEDGDKKTVLIPRKNNALNIDRNLVDVGFSMNRLENPITKDQE